MIARTVSSVARRVNGATGDILPTSESMKRPVANGTAIPAAVNTIKRGEYTKTTAGEDNTTDARNRILANFALLFLSVAILASYTMPSRESDKSG